MMAGPVGAVGQLLFAPWAWAYSTIHPLGVGDEYRLQLGRHKAGIRATLLVVHVM